METSILIAISGTAIAVYYDLKEARIPNRLVYSMFLLSIPPAVMRETLSQWTINVIHAFVISYLFWRLRVWAGGDSKLLIALAALIPVYPDLGILPKPAYSNLFFLSIVMNLLVVHVIYVMPLALIGKINIHRGIRLSPLILVSLLLSILVGDLMAFSLNLLQDHLPVILDTSMIGIYPQGFVKSG
jgi:hypothetical protein